jgi:hypothetical protein
MEHVEDSSCKRAHLPHQPLSDPTRCTRLFKLLPGQNEDPIRCQMSEHVLRLPAVIHQNNMYRYLRNEETDLTDSDTNTPGADHTAASIARNYISLPYTWGSAHDLKGLIQLNNQQFLIHRALWEFLHQFRSREIKGWIWADAICIDQHNILERNAQV